MSQPWAARQGGLADALGARHRGQVARVGNIEKAADMAQLYS
ncbi:MAG: hypothetical protein U1D35_07135 [Paracoccaceae bacterium]|nr:hypothetical protein [Paracoccaceae bacterium]